MHLLKVLKLAAVSAVTLLGAGTVHAATVTQLIHFDDAKNGAKSYSDVDKNFLFDPTNLQSSVLCADTTEASGNGSCLIEGKQGVMPTMTRLSGDGTFSLDGFYFLLTGKGTGSENAITATAYSLTNVLLGAVTFQLGGIYGEVTQYLDGAAAGPLVKNTGYLADLTGLSQFQNVGKITFSAATSAQVRLDCVVATFDGATTEPLSSFNQGCGAGETTPPPVPLPAAGWLMLAGLAGLAAVRRRKTA